MSRWKLGICSEGKIQRGEPRPGLAAAIKPEHKTSCFAKNVDVIWWPDGCEVPTVFLRDTEAIYGSYVRRSG
jgi:hypothetical protein